MPYPLLNLIAYIIMLTMNTLAISLPLGGVTTQELSDKFNNPFTPIGFTFSIWSVIYTLLLIFVLIDFVRYFRKQKVSTINKNIGYLFAISCALNGLWILAWHYQYILLSVGVMIGLLVTLIRIHIQIRKTPAVSTSDKYITLPAFSIYLGWISVATIANIAAWTVSINWSGLGLSQITWTNIMVVVATLLGATILTKFRDIWFNIVIIWALYGIIAKRLSIDPIMFASIISIAQICIAFLVGAISTKIVLKK